MCLQQQKKHHHFYTFNNEKDAMVCKSPTLSTKIRNITQLFLWIDIFSIFPCLNKYFRKLALTIKTFIFVSFNDTLNASYKYQSKIVFLYKNLRFVGYTIMPNVVFGLPDKNKTDSFMLTCFKIHHSLELQ